MRFQLKFFTPFAIRFAVATVALTNLSGCFDNQTKRPNVDAKISPDGSWLVAAEYGKTGTELKIKKLNPSSSTWQKISVPEKTGSFNFSSSTNDLLITYTLGEGRIFAKLHSDEGYVATDIYRSELGLAFPYEVSSDKYLIQAVTRVTPNGYPIHRWKLVTSHKVLAEIGDEFGPPYDSVNLVGDSGFFIVTDIDKPNNVRAFALPNGVTPDIKKYVVPETIGLKCDRAMKNCLQENRYLDNAGYYSRIFRIVDNEKCELLGFPRSIRRISMTPDGKYAAIVGAKDTKTKLAVDVVSFIGGACTSFIKFTEEI